MLPTVGSTDARTWRLADVVKNSFEGSRGVGRPGSGHGLVRHNHYRADPAHLNIAVTALQAATSLA
jgi:hypothetical protein